MKAGFMKLIGTKEEIETLLHGLPRHYDEPLVSVDRLKRNNLWSVIT